MNDSQRIETDARPLEGQDNVLAEWTAELEQRIELLEGDIALLYKAARLAGLRERELLVKLGLRDEMLQRHNSELVAEIGVLTHQQR